MREETVHLYHRNTGGTGDRVNNHRLDNLEGMDELLETHNPPRKNQEKNRKSEQTNKE